MLPRVDGRSVCTKEEKTEAMGGGGGSVGWVGGVQGDGRQEVCLTEKESWRQRKNTRRERGGDK